VRVPFRYPEPRPIVTADVVLFTMRAADLAVLVVRRAGAPHKGQWALPGGRVQSHEALDQAAARELLRETGVQGVPFEQLAAFGAPARDPRGHAISVVFFSFVVAESHPVVPGADAADVRWLPLREIALGDRPARGAQKLAFDHATLVMHARDRLQERLHDPMRLSAFELVPPRFTLSELQRVYEAVFGRSLDKRNFRARLLAHSLVEPVAAARRTGRHRPAQLYRWRRRR
jgi:8-oxo-dGTP diphosphatase